MGVRLPRTADNPIAEAQPTYPVNPADGKPAAAGGAPGTSDTTEATQLLVKAALDTINTNLGVIDGRVDGIEGLLATQAGYLDGVEIKLDTINTSLNTTATELPKAPLLATSDLSYVFDSSSAAGERSLVTATAGQTTKGYRMTVTAAAATVIEFRDGAAGAALFTIEFPAAGAYVYDLDSRPWFKTAANTALIRNSSVATKVTVALHYVKGA